MCKEFGLRVNPPVRLAGRGPPCRGGPRRSYTHILCVHVYICSIGYIPFTLHICTCGGGGCGGSCRLFRLHKGGLTRATPRRPRCSYLHILCVYVYILFWVYSIQCMYIYTCGGGGCGGNCRLFRLQKETSRVEVGRGVAINTYYVYMCIWAGAYGGHRVAASTLPPKHLDILKGAPP